MGGRDMKEKLEKIYNSFLGNESFHPALMGKIEFALEEAYIQGRLERKERMVPNNPCMNTGWVNIYGNIHTNVISCGKKIFTARYAAVHDKYRDKDDLIYVATVRIDW